MNLYCLRVSKCFHLFNFLKWPVVAALAKREMCSSSTQPLIYCMFLPTSSDWIFLKDYMGVFLCFMLRSAAAGMATLHCCWQLSALVRSPHKMLELNSFFQSDGGPSFLQDSKLFVRDWCTGQLNSRGDCKLQTSALGFTMEKWAYLNSCYSCFSAQYWLLLWDERWAVAERKRALQNPKKPQRSELKTSIMISGDLRDWEILIRTRGGQKHHFMDGNFRKDGLRDIWLNIVLCV